MGTPYRPTVDDADRRVETWLEHDSWGRAPLLELLGGDAPWERLVVVAAHPDDESIGAGGLIIAAHALAIPIYLVLLTAGEASDTTVTDGSHHALAQLRLKEMGCAVEHLAPGTPVVFLGAQDGQVASCEDKIAANLVESVGAGARTLVAAPWRHDRHPDHEAAGRAAATACAATGAGLLEYPVETWLRGLPADLPWEQLVRVDLDEERRQRKAEAIACHVSQVPVMTGRTLPNRFDHIVAGPEQYVATFAHAADGAIDRADRAGRAGQSVDAAT